ncbi:unnamed protein product [Prorocentrum cordatum]|uniref:Palmitoyltransferase n=1 Tax=Prorocentrum cordatum TaxID=2364126 RepID=A0ABN9XH04_9DINO|nr:unnamed protein product [Polarella glacialis]
MEPARRKLAPQSRQAEEASGEACGEDVRDRSTDTLDATSKARRAPLAAVAAARSLVKRRGNDLMWISVVLGSEMLGYVYVTSELLQPDGVQVRWASLLCQALLALMMASWAGVKYHGPGMVPPSGASKVPDAVARALKAGKFCESHPFDARDSWCPKCDHWKPVWAHHCSVCNRCSMWMDHHCHFTGECIGFRNFRCFLVWLFYTLMLLLALVTVAIRALIVCPPAGNWAWARFAAFVAFMLMFLQHAVSYFMYSVRKVIQLLAASATIAPWRITGWHSMVTWEKFRAVVIEYTDQAMSRIKSQQRIISHAQLTDPQAFLEARAANGALHVYIQELQRCRDRLLNADGTLRGLFSAGDPVSSLSAIFGEPLSWRWILPLRPRMSGDPFTPGSYDEDACAAWEALADCLEDGEVRRSHD